MDSPVVLTCAAVKLSLVRDNNDLSYCVLHRVKRRKRAFNNLS